MICTANSWRSFKPDNVSAFHWASRTGISLTYRSPEYPSIHCHSRSSGRNRGIRYLFGPSLWILAITLLAARVSIPKGILAIAKLFPPLAPTDGHADRKFPYHRRAEQKACFLPDIWPLKTLQHEISTTRFNKFAERCFCYLLKWIV